MILFSAEWSVNYRKKRLFKRQRGRSTNTRFRSHRPATTVERRILEILLDIKTRCFISFQLCVGLFCDYSSSSNFYSNLVPLKSVGRHRASPKNYLGKHPQSSQTSKTTQNKLTMAFHPTGITVDLVGTESPTQGRSCDEHLVCGSLLCEDNVVRFRKVQFVINSECWL
jgi:hypothetical protein